MGQDGLPSGTPPGLRLFAQRPTRRKRAIAAVYTSKSDVRWTDTGNPTAYGKEQPHPWGLLLKLRIALSSLVGSHLRNTKGERQQKEASKMGGRVPTAGAAVALLLPFPAFPCGRPHGAAAAAGCSRSPKPFEEARRPHGYVLCCLANKKGAYVSRSIT